MPARYSCANLVPNSSKALHVKWNVKAKRDKVSQKFKWKTFAVPTRLGSVSALLNLSSCWNNCGSTSGAL